ncbi:hypothetical protein BLNAU_19342 [Blattamonas nauphoetae]|uniref:Uncharacterized protein n=1 Tax=Blattamonas nauphoetae TaxID=2049346 RepID=A0ABQ9X2Z4_9EUKA|nr:hypothetical protein BLNAU_19342 [Blattamonas nauphoetae]
MHQSPSLGYTSYSRNSCRQSRNDASTAANPSQRIVGCHVSDCSNHLYGTACRDINAGGCLLSHNTSFLRCTTDASVRRTEYFSTRTDLTTSSTDSSFTFDLCTFKSCSGSNTNGGAINLERSGTNLDIEDCSFESCWIYYVGVGGAVYHDVLDEIETKTVVNASSFVKCSTHQNCGGSVEIINSLVVVVSNCAFLDSSAFCHGGALHVNDHGVPRINVVMSNSLFQNCETRYTANSPGGACYFDRVVSVQLDSLCFRKNTAASVGGHDLFFNLIPDVLDANTVTNCVSSSTPNTNRCYPTSYSHLLPDQTITITMSFALEQHDDQATVTLTLHEVVSGTILVFVSNEKGSRPEIAGTAPKIGRLLFVNFFENSSGSAIVSCGEDGLLQPPLTEYEVVTASFFPAQELLIVDAPRFNEKMTEVKVDMEGKLLEGSYTLTLSINSSETNTVTMMVTFASSSGTLNEIVYDAETPTNVKLSFNTIYSVVKMEKNGKSALVKEGLFFDTGPEPERLTAITAGEAESTPASTTTLLNFGSRVLRKAEEYTLTLISTAIPDHPSHERTIKLMTDANGELKTFTSILYPLETDEAAKAGQLDFGVEYKVKGFVVGTTPVLFDEGKTTFTTPPEPARIEVCVDAKLCGDRNSVRVVLSGRALKDGLGRVFATNGTSFWESTSNLDYCSPSECTASFLTGKVEDSSKLGFGEKYSIVSSPSTPSLFVVNENVELSVPNAPIVTTTTTELNVSTHLSFHVLIRGTDLPSSGVFDASLEGVSETIEITFDGGEGRSKWIEVRKSTALQFNKTYTLSSFFRSESGKEDQHVLCNGNKMKTPEGPTLLRVDRVDMEGPEKVTAAIHFVVERMPVGSFQVAVVDITDTTQANIELTVAILDVSDTTTEILESVGEAGKLKYGHSYRIVGMSSSDVDVSIPSPLNIVIPVLSRFESLTVAPNTLGTSILVSFSGSNLTGSYVVTLDSDFSFAIAASSPTHAASSEILLGWSDGLPFSSTFTLSLIASTSSSSSVLLTPSLLLDTPPKPTELILFVNSLSLDSTRFCGEKTRPCSSFDAAWVIVKGIDVKRATLSIIDSASLNAPIEISDQMVVLFSNGGNQRPTLTIPSSVSMGEKKGMVLVESAILTITDVTVVIESTLSSFVFLFSFNSTVFVQLGSFSGLQAVNSPIANDSEEDVHDICSWSSGVLQLENSSTELSSSVISNLPQGAINMKGGSLTMETSAFRGNTPTLSPFPSARRNIHCSENGLIEIGSLSAGDGLETGSAWMSTSDCQLTAQESISRSPFFVPTLSTDSSSKLVKKTASFSVVISGSTLIPCGLTLEVFEVNENKSEGKQTEMDLDLDSTSSFTETEVTLSIALSSLSSLSPSLEWRGRLRFGENLETNESFVIQLNSADRRSEIVLANMKWWLPVVIVAGLVLLGLIVIVCLCYCRRRKNEKKSETSQAEELASQVDLEKMDDVDEDEITDKTEDFIDKAQIEPDCLSDLIGPRLIVTEERLVDGRKKDDDERNGLDGGFEDQEGERGDVKEEEMENEVMERPHKKKKRKKTKTVEGENEDATVPTQSTEEQDRVDEVDPNGSREVKRKRKKKTRMEEAETVEATMAAQQMEDPDRVDGAEDDGNGEVKKKRKKKTRKEEDEQVETTFTSPFMEKQDDTEGHDENGEEKKKRKKKKKKADLEENDHLLIDYDQNADTVKEAHQSQAKEGEGVEGEMDGKKKKKKKKKPKEIVESENMLAQTAEEIEKTTLRDESNSIGISTVADEVEGSKRRKKRKVEMKEAEHDMGG